MTVLDWLLCAVLLAADCLAYRWLLRIHGETAGLGRPATLEEVAVWHLKRLEEQLSWWLVRGNRT